ncbi:MAG TPA: VWA domain-containing protein [Planctomycetes bacterium]|nr:VWA domain-containing protein [Planctomycetota bacterium]
MDFWDFDMARIRLTVLSLLVLLAPLGAQTPKDQTPKDKLAKALVDFEKLYRNTNEHVRRAAVDDLGTLKHKALVPILVACLKDKSQVVREAVVPAMANQTTKPALHALTVELRKAKSDVVRIAILKAFKTTRPPVAKDAVLKLATSKSYPVRLLALDLLGDFSDEDGKITKALLHHLEDRDAQVRLTVLDALTRLGYDDLIGLAIRLLEKDKDWRVRAVAVQALRKSREKRVIEPLIEAMEREKGRLITDIRDALADITQTTYGPKPELWRRWWERVKGGFKVPTPEEIAKRKAKLAKDLARYGIPKKGTTPFQGIQSKSRRMLFILDVSGSMQDKLSLEGGDPKAIEAFRERYGQYETKIDLAREELITTVANLPSYTKFNIFLFHNDVISWKKHLTRATQGNKNQAIKFLAKLTPQWIEDVVVKQGKGQTNTFAALNKALGLADEPQEKPSKNHTVESDTVFFLSDGMPTVGRIRDPQELLRYVRTVNARAKIVFHTLTFGHGNVALLRPLAEWSGGKYIEIGVN